MPLPLNRDGVFFYFRNHSFTRCIGRRPSRTGARLLRVVSTVAITAKRGAPCGVVLINGARPTLLSALELVLDAAKRGMLPVLHLDPVGRCAGPVGSLAML
jgi:hypothetical protein